MNRSDRRRVFKWKVLGGRPVTTVVLRQDRDATPYELFVSALVFDECRGGDPDAAAERHTILDGIPLIGSSPEAETLVNALLDRAVPKSEPRDATHIAIATTNGIDYLVSWNFKHILNPDTIRQIESVCRDAGYDPPMLVTPQQLFESFDDS